MTSTFTELIDEELSTMAWYYRETETYLTNGMLDADRYQCHLNSIITPSAIEFSVLIFYVTLLMSGVCYLLYRGLIITHYPEGFSPSDSEDELISSHSDSLSESSVMEEESDSEEDPIDQIAN